jgi:SAM-dependent methyltransferase
MADNWRELNRANWDERVAVHLAPGGYDLSPMRAANGRLDAIVEGELGAVAGLRVLHLQCHFGKDSLILASRGAKITGLDFSGPAIRVARSLAAELRRPARFVQADLYDAPTAIPEPASFDLVFTTWGTVTWLPDVDRWARVVVHFLRPGGALYFADAHPAARVFDDIAWHGRRWQAGLVDALFRARAAGGRRSHRLLQSGGAARQPAPGELAAHAGRDPGRTEQCRPAAGVAAGAPTCDVAHVSLPDPRFGRLLGVAGPAVATSFRQLARRTGIAAIFAPSSAGRNLH